MLQWAAALPLGCSAVGVSGTAVLHQTELLTCDWVSLASVMLRECSAWIQRSSSVANSATRLCQHVHHVFSMANEGMATCKHWVVVSAISVTDFVVVSKKMSNYSMASSSLGDLSSSVQISGR